MARPLLYTLEAKTLVGRRAAVACVPLAAAGAPEEP